MRKNLLYRSRGLDPHPHRIALDRDKDYVRGGQECAVAEKRCFAVSVNAIVIEVQFPFFFFFPPPALEEELTQVEVDYLSMPGWNCNTEAARTFADLPPNAQAYIRKIEELMNVPGRHIRFIGQLFC